MDWLNPEPRTPKMRFRAMMESGLLVDEEADIIQTQVIAHKARASIRNRKPVPLYHQTEEGRRPTYRETLLVETGLERPPGEDSRYVLEDSRTLFEGLHSGAVEIDADSKLKSYGIQIVANVAAVIIFCGCAWLASLNVTEDNVRPADVHPVVAAMEEFEAQDDTGSEVLQSTSVDEDIDHGDTQTRIEDAAAQDEFGHGMVDGIPAPEPPDDTETEEPKQ